MNSLTPVSFSAEPGQYRNQRPFHYALLDARHHLFVGYLFAFQVLHRQVVVNLRDRFHQPLARFLSLVRQLVRRRFVRVKQVHDPGETNPPVLSAAEPATRCRPNRS